MEKKYFPFQYSEIIIFNKTINDNYLFSNRINNIIFILHFNKYTQ